MRWKKRQEKKKKNQLLWQWHQRRQTVRGEGKKYRKKEYQGVSPEEKPWGGDNVTTQKP